MTTTGRIPRTEEEQRKRPINRLQTMYAVRAYADEMYKKLEQAGKEEKPVAWCMAEPFARHILNAMDIETIFPENYAGICAAADQAIPFIDRAVDDGFPNYVCGYLTNTLGYAARMKELGDIPPEAPRGGMPKPVLLLMSSMACDARNKGFASLGRYLDTPEYTLECPTPGQREQLLPGAYERDVRYLIKNIYDFVAFLEKLMGKKCDLDRVEDDLNRTMRLENAWHEVTDEMRKARPCPMNARDHLACMTTLFFNTTEPEKLLEMVKNMKDEVQYRLDNGIAGINRPEKYRLAFSGLGPWANMNLFDMWADKGWNFPREGYHPPDPIDLSDVKDPIEKIVRYRSQGLERGLDSDYSPEEAAEIKKEIMEKGYSHKAVPGVRDAKNYQLDGVIQYCNFSCRPTATNTLLSQYQLMEACKVPSIVVEADMIDKRVLDVDGLMKRCEAFEETMDHFKEVRKQEGLEW